MDLRKGTVVMKSGSQIERVIHNDIIGQFIKHKGMKIRVTEEWNGRRFFKESHAISE